MEKITLQCSLCNKTIDTTHDEFMQQQKKRGHKCPLCNHGDLSIIWGEYSELALIIHRAAKELEKLALDPMDLVYRGEVPVFEKYDEFLPEELVKKGFAYGILGIEQMKMRIRSWQRR